MTVVDIRNARRQAQNRMRARVDKDGDLVFKLPGAPEYAVEGDVAIGILKTLLGGLIRARDRKLGLQPRVEKAPRVDRPRGCHRLRDGGCYGFGGCRRRRGHQGECRDAAGDYTPAVCSHIGTGRCRVTIPHTGEEFFTCQRCGSRVDP